LVGLKELENDVLKLGEKLIPLSTSYTQPNSTPEDGDDTKKNSDEQNPEEDGENGKVIDTNPDEGGRPTKKDGEKSEETIVKEEGKK
jgi:hypothetical protein